MTTFDDREKGFENKFVREEELTFRAMARRNKLLGLWAAGKLGKSGEEAEQYALTVVAADFEDSGHGGLVDKLHEDFSKADLSISLNDIHLEMERLLPLAMAQIMGR